MARLCFALLCSRRYPTPFVQFTVIILFFFTILLVRVHLSFVPITHTDVHLHIYAHIQLHIHRTLFVYWIEALTKKCFAYFVVIVLLFLFFFCWLLSRRIYRIASSSSMLKNIPFCCCWCRFNISKYHLKGLFFSLFGGGFLYISRYMCCCFSYLLLLFLT